MMKPLRTGSLALAGLMLAGLLAANPAEAGVSFSFFYSNLSPHGHWLVSGSYGRVWQPAVYYPGWNPYYDGGWEYTDVGWYWNSEYPWGYIPYHYGTWVVDPFYGWVWVPGTTWASSWVTWRTGPGYIGWAPVAPSFSIGVSFGFGGYYPYTNYVFLPANQFLCGHVGARAVPIARNSAIINDTTVINNIDVVNNRVVNRGPSVSVVERATHTRVRAVPVTQVRSVRSLQAAGLGRDPIRIDPQVRAHGLRAAEPVSASTPIPRLSRGPNQDARKARGRGGETGAAMQNEPMRRAPFVREAPRGPMRTREAPTLQEISPNRSSRAGAARQPSLEARGAPRMPSPQMSPRIASPSRGSSAEASRGRPAPTQAPPASGQHQRKKRG